MSHEPFRLRCKVYTDPKDGTRWLVPMVMYDPKTDRAAAMAMRDGGETRTLRFTVDEYNALPFHWFEDQGPAERYTTNLPDELAKKRPS